MSCFFLYYVTLFTLELLTNFPVTGSQTLHHQVWATYPVFLHCLGDPLATAEEPLPKLLCNIALCWWLQWLLISTKVVSMGCVYSAEHHLNKMSHIRCLVNL